ncbi:MAG: potassium channel protein [Actinobacteria bacterium]|nr:MAG: potassium channel protein [Actinomycetota bacterium]
MDILKRSAIIFTVLLVVLILGTVGNMLIVGLTFVDALYMTVITITTVGFGLERPLNASGKIFTIFLIFGGVGTATYAVTSVVQFIVQGYFRDILGRRKMTNQISKLKDHYIICGFGRIGQNIIKELVKNKKKFVVVEKNPEIVTDVQEAGYLVVEGDATDDAILESTNIKEAKGLVAALDDDADNVFIALSARRLKATIFIIARANAEETEGKLLAAGADRVVSPSIIGGRRMAATLLKPAILDYLDYVTHSEELEYHLEELKVMPGSKIADVSIADSHIRKNTGALVLAIKRGEELNTNPSTDTVILAGDNLIVLGTGDQLKSLSNVVTN